MQLTMTLTTETQSMAISGRREVKSRGRSARADYDDLVPYRSRFTRQSWTLRPGSSRCVCAACHDGFNSVFAFDKHQVMKSDGDVICRDPATLGMVRNADGWWITEAREMEA